MRRTAIVLMVAVLLGFIPAALSAQSGEDAKFKKFQDTFWDSYYKFFPTQGSVQGYAKYKDKLEDFSAGAVEKFHDGLDAVKQDLISKIDQTKLSPDMQIEHGMMLDFLELEFMKFESLLPWEYNPLYYNQIIVESVRSLLIRSPQAPDAVAGAVARAKALPAFIKKAQENMKTPPEDYTKAAIEQMPAIIDFYRTEVGKLCSSAALQAESAKVASALEEYQTYLKSQLLPKSTGNFRLGEAHQTILRMKAQGNLGIQEIIKASQEEPAKVRNEMFLVCLPYFDIMYPAENIEQIAKTKGAEGMKQYVIQAVYDKLKADHAGKDEYAAALSAAADKVKKFFQDKGLVNLPAETLSVEAMPAYLPATAPFVLEGPGAFDAVGSWKLYVKPIPDSLAPEQVTSLLEAYNNGFLPMEAAQYAYPGTFVPTVQVLRNATSAKKIMANIGLIKGWPIYVKNLLLENGYANYDLWTRLNQLKLQLKNVILFQMDMNIHEGTYPKDKVISYMTTQGLMTAGEAEVEWRNIVLNPGDAALAYIGLKEIQDIERAYKAAKGDAFNAKEFLDRLVSFGPIPMRALKGKVLS